jgi:hypothetical protein
MIAVDAGATPQDKARHGFRICLTRPPYDRELARLVELYEESRAGFESQPEQARQLVAGASGPPAGEQEVTELAAWTVVANVLLNLDELLMKR